MRRNLIIRGKSKTENCVQLINNFFKVTMKIADEVKVQSAFRMGAGKNRPILATLATPSEKSKIYGNVKNLKGVTNAEKAVISNL